jgi:hypothetical protein
LNHDYNLQNAVHFSVAFTNSAFHEVQLLMQILGRILGYEVAFPDGTMAEYSANIIVTELYLPKLTMMDEATT